MSTLTTTTTTTTTTATVQRHGNNSSNEKHNSSTKQLQLLINNRWYNLTKWQYHHPGGSQILHYLHQQDATDAFYSLHSQYAIEKLKQMYSVPATHTHTDNDNDTHGDVDTSVDTPNETLSFRKLRYELEQDGWFQRSVLWECFYTLQVYILCMLGTYLTVVYGQGFWGILCIGIGMQQAGWIGHDYTHGRGDWCYYSGRLMAGVINGFSSRWWSNKHNTHHCYTNHIGIDDDIANEPIFYLFYPSADKDTPWLRQYQHIYMIPVYSFLYISWRIQSIQYAWKHQIYSELFFISLNYIWLFMVLPISISLSSILLGGLLVACIVTASHQSEEMYEGTELMNHSDSDSERSTPGVRYNFVRNQFESTRDAITENFFLEYLWGGMQYQLEHHLFPTMPKYRYAKLQPIIEKWAKDNSLPYKSESSIRIIKRNYDTIKLYAQIPPTQS